MATAKTPQGSAFLGPDGQVAVKMGSGVTAGEFFVIHPDHGGHYTADAENETILDEWPTLVADPESVKKAEAKKAEKSSATPADVPTPPKVAAK